MSRRRSSLKSSLTFFSFCRGRMTSRRPTRRAASTFSLMPPTGSTRPDSVISPVIARSPRTGRPVSSDTSAVTIVTPAEGPSFGMAPDGHVQVDLGRLEEVRVDAELARVGAHPRQRGARRLLHHVAEVAGQRERAACRPCAWPRRTARRRPSASRPGRWPRRACACAPRPPRRGTAARRAARPRRRA